MLIKADCSQLEWRVKIFLSQDKTGMREIEEGLDLHLDNQKKFGLPSRLISKIFVYRMVFADAFGPQGYSGPAYAYANDADFQQASTSKKYWEGVVTKFFEKYPEIREHSLALIREATTTGRILSPSGRFYPFTPYTKWNGEMDWPRTNMVNYPVQGLAADFVQCARLDIWNWYQEFDRKQALLINTVHDDVELDVDNDPELVYNICHKLIESFRGIPKSFEKRYGVKINVPQDAEVKFGFSLAEANMFKFNESTFKEDYNKCLSVQH